MLKNKFLNILRILGIIILALFILFALYTLLFSKEERSISETVSHNYQAEETLEDDFPNSTIMHWPHLPVTYRFDENCIGREPDRMRWGFDVLANSTNYRVRFLETNGSEQNIFITCSPDQSKDRDLITLGEAEPWFIEDYYLIYNVTIRLYSVREDSYPTSCHTFPSMEVHEIIHAMGFIEHSTSPTSVFYPYQDWCYQTKIDNYIIGNLTEAYS